MTVSCPIGMLLNVSTRGLPTNVLNTVMLVFLGIVVVLWIAVGVLWWRVWSGHAPISGPPLYAAPPARRSHCHSCGYALDGLANVSRCPECGVAVDSGTTSTPQNNNDTKNSHLDK